MSNNINRIHNLEKAFVFYMNTMYDWNLNWTGEGMSNWDAEGSTAKGNKCVVEMKFRKTYYETKMIEVFKYDKLMSLDKDIVKLYFVSDPKGSYMFYLNELNDLSKESLSCPKNTMWNGAKTNKDVYLLSEDSAIMKQQFNTKLF